MYILRRLSVFFSSWANIDIPHVDSRLLWIETWFIQPLGLVIPAVVFLFFSSRAEAAVQMARWQSTSLQPKRGGAARPGHHPPPHTHKITPFHCSHTRSKSSGFVLDCNQIALSATYDHYYVAHVLRSDPSPHLGLGYTLTPREAPGRKHFFIQNLLMQEWRRMLQRMDSPRCQRTKTSAPRCSGLRLASAALLNKMNYFTVKTQQKPGSVNIYSKCQCVV